MLQNSSWLQESVLCAAVLVPSCKTTVTYVSEKAHVTYTHYNQMNMPVFNNKSRNNNTFLETRIAYRKKENTRRGNVFLFVCSLTLLVCLFHTFYIIVFFRLLVLFQSRFAIYQRASDPNFYSWPGTVENGVSVLLPFCTAFIFLKREGFPFVL